MKSPLGSAIAGVRDQLTVRSPIPLSSRAASYTSGWFTRNDVVGQLQAMTSVGTLFAIVDRLATACSQNEWNLWREAKSGLEKDRTPVTSHAAVDLWEKPNPFMPRSEFVECGQQHYELVGEEWWVIARDPRARIPLEMWPVRPDRMVPLPHPEKYLSGYEYVSPDGERIPLRLDEVVLIRRPNPVDPYRGIGPVQSILADLEANRLSAEWNRNFFLNSAEPGGIVEVDRTLSDRDFRQMVDRWQEQHKGVSRAHRVAIVEKGKWVDRKYTMRDMQFAELRGVARDVIREAYGFPKSMLGVVEDVNRANADAMETLFAQWLTVPRLNRRREALNTRLLPMFGPATTTGLTWDYVSPVPKDREADNAELTAKVNAAQVFIGTGFDRSDVLRALELPDIAVAAAPALPPGTEQGKEPGTEPETEPGEAASTLAEDREGDLDWGLFGGDDE